MEQREIKALLEKYWRAETTLEEEKRLADYLLQPETDPELRPFRQLFLWRTEEAQLSLDEGFDDRILRQLPNRYSFGFAVAAAAILCVAISCLLVITGPSTEPLRQIAVQPPVQGRPAGDKGVKAISEMKDTYADPQQALAAVRHALLIASAGISEGQQITRKNITRLHNSWQAATGD